MTAKLMQARRKGPSRFTFPPNRRDPRNGAYHSSFGVVARYWRIEAKSIWVLCTVMSGAR